MNWAPARIPPRELREVYLHPFEAAVRIAGARSVMNAYNEIDGMLCAADRDLLTGPLRDEWGFDGFVVVRLLLDPAARRLPPARGGRRERRGDWRSRPVSTSSCRSTDCYGAPAARAIAPGSSPRRRSTTRCGACCATKFDLGLFERAVRRRRRPSPARIGVEHTATSRRRSRARASCCCATTASCRSPPDVRLDRRDRPERRRAPQPLRRLLLPRARRVAARDARERAERLLDRTAADGSRSAPTMLEAPSVLDALRARFGAGV